MKSRVTRRSLLAGLGGLSSAAAVQRTTMADEQTSKPRRHLSKIEDIEKDYRRLLPLWQKEREQFSFSSRTDDYWQGPNGKAIIALGPAIIPYLIQEVRKGDFFFNVPLQLIISADVAKDCSEQDRAKLWLKWFDSGQAGTRH